MPSCCTPPAPVRSPKEFLTERKRHLEKLRERKTDFPEGGGGKRNRVS